MPTYPYLCNDCGYEFGVTTDSFQNETERCPHCQTLTAEPLSQIPDNQLSFAFMKKEKGK